MIPKVRTWRVRIVDTETGAIVSEAIVDAPNRLLARMNSGLRLRIGQRFTVSPGPGTTLTERNGVGEVTTIEIAN